MPCLLPPAISPGFGLAESAAHPLLQFGLCRRMHRVVSLVDPVGLPEKLRHERFPVSCGFYQLMIQPMNLSMLCAWQSLALTVPALLALIYWKRLALFFKILTFGCLFTYGFFCFFPEDQVLGWGYLFLLWRPGEPGLGGSGRLVLSQGEPGPEKSLGVRCAEYRSGGNRSNSLSVACRSRASSDPLPNRPIIFSPYHTPLLSLIPLRCGFLSCWCETIRFCAIIRRSCLRPI